MSRILNLIRDNRGVGAFEFALIASLLSVAAVTAFGNLGHAVQHKYEQVDTKLGEGINYKK
ncbi:Flp family type IVb pilin [Sphingomonas sp. HDW15A]|uniref:Flp family type IVb pilin n=1 Tax=Sphingomonas sp. HDW15A TaxID=2714942 RepID=UPI00140BD67D|nr:Flp family type IVb pilin [Sphingomonas sp. HDW15A]QIK97070.1 Flp family type IVb pilin [Sphingomonas sp. HDW15A]